MTTIAYKEGILAGDTRVVDDDLIDPGEVRKVFRLKNGMLIGFAGPLGHIQESLRKIRKDPDGIHAITKGVNAIVVYPDGVVKVLDDGGWTETKAKYFAIGSGKIPALVAMSCGKTAREAIKIAMDFDGNTGGKVTVVKLR